MRLFKSRNNNAAAAQSQQPAPLEDAGEHSDGHDHEGVRQQQQQGSKNKSSARAGGVGALFSSRRTGGNAAGQPSTGSQTPGTINGPSVRDVIGRFCGLPGEDWSYVLDLADSLSTSEAASKEAAETIRQELKHGIPQAQERAVRLLVVLMRNTTDRFKLQIANKRFLKTIEATFQSPKTEPRVKAMIYKASGLLAYEFKHDMDLQPLVSLYINIKPPEAPVDGIPLEDGDTTFDPVNSGPQPRFSRTRAARNQFDPQEQMNTLVHRIAVAKNEAGMLNEALAYSSAENYDRNEIVQEFYPKVVAWQDFVVQQIPWAQAEADRAHREREQQETETANPSNGPRQEEKLLDDLLLANTEINDALAAYHRLEQEASRKKQEDADLAAARELSMAETRFDRQTGQHYGAAQPEAALEPETPTFESVYLSAPLAAAASSSTGSSRGVTPDPASADADEARPVSQSAADGGTPFDQVYRQELSDPPVHASPRAQDQDVTFPAYSPSLSRKNPYARYSDENPMRMPTQISPVLENGYMVDEPEEAAANSPATNPFYHAPRVRKDSDRTTMSVPKEPSEKALGKLRRVSGMPMDAQQQQKLLEEQLRERYERDFEAQERLKAQRAAGDAPQGAGGSLLFGSSTAVPAELDLADLPPAKDRHDDSALSDVNARVEAMAVSKPDSDRPGAQKSQHASILEEYDPYRAY